MRAALWLIGLFAVAVAAALFAGSNRGSVRFHEKQGFSLLGCFHNIGYKNGRWLDVLWYEKQIAAYDEPLPCTLFERLDQAEVQAILDEANA